MTAGDFAAIAPLLILAGTCLALMLVTAFCRNHRLVAGLALLGLTAAAAATVAVWPMAPRQVTALLVIDRYALFYLGLMVAAALTVAAFSYDYLEMKGEGAGSTQLGLTSMGHREPVARREEYYILLALATTGAAVLVCSVHFTSFFLGVELMSISLYALVAYPRANRLNIEAGIKYLILAGVSSSFLLFGMALVYMDLGTMAFEPLVSTGGLGPRGLLVLPGLGMILVGVGFKLSLVPFHLWAPDVYEGAPAPATAFVATVSKGAVFAVFLRYAIRSQFLELPSVLTAVTLLALASMFIGNWLALLQRNVKRLLAYSSIAHMGYLLVALLASGPLAPMAVAFYLVAYVVTTLGAFGVVSALSTLERDADAIEDYRGLAWRRPWLAAVLSLMLLSLAGIPVTAGFLGKFYVLAAGVESHLWLLVSAMALNSAIGLFYYLRVMMAMYRPVPGGMGEEPEAGLAPSGLGRLVLFALVAALIGLGVYPSPVIRLIQAAMR